MPPEAAPQTRTLLLRKRESFFAHNILPLLKIKNLALIEEVVWEMGPGLIGITGETGSGKSMIIGALKLIVGQRADTELVRTEENTCTVAPDGDLENVVKCQVVLNFENISFNHVIL